MNYFIKRGGLLLVVFLAVFFISYTLRKKIKKHLNNAIIKFEKNEYDFGSLKKDKEVSVYFVYKNISNSELKIKDIKSSCGCTIPIWSKNDLQPNGIDSILVKYDSKKGGYFSKSIFVMYNGQNSPVALKIRGIVSRN